MNNKGFTLVELLAVIIVLSIILLIAIPRIGNVVENSEKESFKLSNNAIITKIKQLQAENLASDSYTITNGVISPNLELNGEMPLRGEISIYDDDIALLTYSDKWCAVKNYNDEAINLYDKDSDECNISKWPREYQEVEYLESSGTPYIDTGYVPKSSTKIELKFRMYVVDNYNSVFGSRDDNNFFVNSGGRSKVMYVWYNESSNYSTLGNFTQNSYNVLTYDSPNNIIRNFNNEDNVIKEKSINFSKFPLISMYLFGRNNSGSYVSASDGMLLWYFKIWDNDILTRDFIPVIRKSDNKPGLYDKVNNKFYTNAGTGEFGYKPFDGDPVLPQ